MFTYLRDVFRKHTPNESLPNTTAKPLTNRVDLIAKILGLPANPRMCSVPLRIRYMEGTRSFRIPWQRSRTNFRGENEHIYSMPSVQYDKLSDRQIDYYLGFVRAACTLQTAEYFIDPVPGATKAQFVVGSVTYATGKIGDKGIKFFWSPLPAGLLSCPMVSTDIAIISDSNTKPCEYLTANFVQSGTHIETDYKTEWSVRFKVKDGIMERNLAYFGDIRPYEAIRILGENLKYSNVITYRKGTPMLRYSA